LPDSQIQDLNKNLVEEELFTPDRMYLDWNLFRDPIIGAAITLLMTSPDQTQAALRFKKLSEKIKNYEARCFNDIAYYIPELNISAQDIQIRLFDPDYQEKIFFAAPFTVFIQTLKAQLNININHSIVKEKFQKIVIRPGQYRKNFDPIRLVINTYPLTLQKRQMDLIGAFLVGNFKVDVDVICFDPKTIDVDLLLSMDEIYTTDITGLLANEPVSKAFTDLKFVAKRIYATRHLGYVREKGLKERAVEAEFIRMRSTLDVLSKFAWIDSDFITYDLDTTFEQE